MGIKLYVFAGPIVAIPRSEVAQKSVSDILGDDVLVEVGSNHSDDDWVSFCGNLKDDGTHFGGYDSGGFIVVTPDVIANQIDDFKAKYAKQIALLRENYSEVEIEWAISADYM